MFKNDKTKKFFCINENFKNNRKADLSISLDVIFHLVEDNAFNSLKSSYSLSLLTFLNKYLISIPSL